MEKVHIVKESVSVDAKGEGNYYHFEEIVKIFTTSSVAFEYAGVLEEKYMKKFIEVNCPCDVNEWINTHCSTELNSGSYCLSINGKAKLFPDWEANDVIVNISVCEYELLNNY